MDRNWSRRKWLSALAGVAPALAVRPARATRTPASTVALHRCHSYRPAELVPALETMFDQIGGLAPIVRHKTVAIKINLTGNADARLGYLPVEATTWTHPAVIAATLHLMDKAGARRIRLLESPWSTDEPLEEFMITAGWDLAEFNSAARLVEYENTNYLGYGKKYHRFPVPHGGHLFPAYDLNHSYADCDTFVSIAKLKEHRTAGITLSMKNCFGITPCTIYGDGAGLQGPSPAPGGGRGEVIHRGSRPPSASAPQENEPKSPRNGGYRVPRVVADLAAARPIDLAIIDGITAQAVGETAGSASAFPVSPGLLLAGGNAVCTDAAGAAVMGFDPMADRGTPPFETCDSTLRLAEELGVGTRDLARIEVAGERIRDVVYDYRALWRRHHVKPPPARLERPAAW